MSSPTPEFLSQNTVVRAGAGAGKTTRLVEEVIRTAKTFHEVHGEWPRMVLTTFTRKATQEIRERLILKACKLEDQQLLEYLSSNTWLQISTIHGVMSLFLRRYGHLVGLDNGYSVITDQEADKEAKKILRDLAIENKQVADLMSLFGLKKLSLLLRSLSSMLLENPEAHFVSEVELKGYWEKYFKEVAKEVFSVISEVRESTDDAKFLEYSDLVEQALSDLFPATLDTSRQMALILERLPRQKPRFSKKDPQFSEELNERLSKAMTTFKKELKRPELQSEQWKVSLEVFSSLQEEARQFHQTYSEKKKFQGQFEMSDLESVTVDILRNNEGLGQAFSTDFDFWLIDEYQDTSPVQVELLNRLVGERPAFVVGDPQQSIYLFRGARSEVFFEREKQVELSKGNLEVKKQNWRSEPELLMFFNDFFKSMPSEFISMDPRSAVENPNKVVAKFCPISKELQENDDEAQWHALAQHIHSLLKSGSQPEDICILGRTNSQLFDIAQYLRFHEYPTHLHVASGFYERREVIDAMALLKFLVSPHDNKNLILLLRSPWCRVSDKDLSQFVFDKKGSFWFSMESAEEFQNHEVVKQLKNLRELRQQFGVTWCFEKALVEFGCIDFSHHHDVSGRRESNFWKLLTRLKEEERKPGFSFLKFINRSFTEMNTESGNEESDAVAALEPNHVQLMTIHSSKGLQFPHVILPDMQKKPATARTPLLSFDNESGAWSAPLPLGENNVNQATVADLFLKKKRKQLEDQESDRVLYVALTRAKSSVFLSWNQPAEVGSWISHIKWDFAPGIHSTTNYSYEVLSGEFSPVNYESDESEQNEIRSLWKNTNVSDRPQKKSVTALVEENQSKMKASSSSASSQLVPERIKKAVEGVLVHRMMEILKFDWEFDFIQVAPVWFGGEAERFLAAVQWVKNQKVLPLRQVIENGYVEWGYQLLKDNSIVEGQIDLWGMIGDELWVVDYKTGSQKYQEQAFTQLEFYSEALKKYVEPQVVHLCVIYPMDQAFKLKTL